MKKFAVGLAILVIYGLYSLGIRHQNPVIAKPRSLTNPTSSHDETSMGGTSNPSAPSSNQATTASYKDGTYTGSAADAYYGNVQVAVTIQSGKIADVKFLQYPDTHGTSVEINQQAMPYLTQEAIQAQSANVQVISGATFTSQAFQQSLQSALSQA